MAKMIATKPQTYATKTLKAGDEFDVDDGYVGTLISLGRATLKDQPSTKVKPTTTKAEEPDNGEKYKTRQMKAKGDK